MGAAASKLDIKNHLLQKAQCLGNSGMGLKEVCSGLIADEINKGRKYQNIADSTYLSAATIERMHKLTECESGIDYRPNVDTCERILKAFGASIYFDQVVIKRKFQNKPKLDV